MRTKSKSKSTSTPNARAKAKPGAAKVKPPARKAKPNKVRNSKKGAVVLLSGGNPQIAKAEGDAPVHTFTRYVKVTFFRGTSLRPIPPGASKHKDVRYFDIHEGELDEAQMTTWVKQAAALPGWIP